MTARTPRERDPRSSWLVTIEAIASYSGCSVEEIGNALREGGLRGNQRCAGGKWRSHTLWIDAWMAGEPAPSITGRRAS